MAISNDASLGADPRDAPGGSFARQLLYASHVARYDVVVRTEPSAKPVTRAASDRLHIRAVPASRSGFVVSGFRAALARAQHAETHIVSCSDTITMGLIGYLLKRRLGIALNLQINGDFVDNPYWLGENRIYPAFNLLARWLIRRADTLRVSTAAERRKYMEGWGLPAERVWNVPFHVDFSPFLHADGAGVRERLEIERVAPLILFLGRLVKAKDLGILLRAMPTVIAYHPRTILVVAGSGPEDRPVRELASELGIERSLRFLGRVPHLDVPALYAASDAFVLSSHYEGTSMVTLEAAASGLPVVSTDVPGAPDAVLDGISGLIVPRRDPAALAAALIALLDDPDRAKEMGSRGRAHVLERFEPHRIARQMAELWLGTIRVAA